jgi:hypothetical protein
MDIMKTINKYGPNPVLRKPTLLGDDIRLGNIHIALENGHYKSLAHLVLLHYTHFIDHAVKQDGAHLAEEYRSAEHRQRRSLYDAEVTVKADPPLTQYGQWKEDTDIRDFCLPDCFTMMHIFRMLVDDPPQESDTNTAVDMLYYQDFFFDVPELVKVINKAAGIQQNANTDDATVDPAKPTEDNTAEKMSIPSAETTVTGTPENNITRTAATDTQSKESVAGQTTPQTPKNKPSCRKKMKLSAKKLKSKIETYTESEKADVLDDLFELIKNSKTKIIVPTDHVAHYQRLKDAFVAHGPGRRNKEDDESSEE